MTAGVFVWIGKTVEHMTPIDALITPRLYMVHGTRIVTNSPMDRAHTTICAHKTVVQPQGFAIFVAT